MIVRRGIQTIALAGVIVAFVATPAARADNKRLNDAVVANVYTAQHQAGCTNDVKINPQLQLAAEWHAKDVLNNRNLVDDIGSDGSGPQDRANAAGFHGQVGETVAINPAAAISGVELINQWYYNPAHFAIMSNCANSQIGVWSENSPDRTVVVAVYGRPQQLVDPPRRRAETSPMAAAPGQSENIPLDPSPDYDASDELEFGISWFPWILRGVYPPPAHPPE
ncbi:CAP domain-containing protein [Mycobacterium branderi]|nr:CAP domain-containing protein [Mycobacterium branderi]MCV7236325.1 CAP domain-containing protein [Mycobacterium branderi]ORA35491.1 hypothetical protein BST20_18075 [Mycobacterium branderi]